MQEIIITKKINNEVLKGEVKYKVLSFPQRIEASKKSVTKVVATDAGPETTINENLDRSLEYYELACKQVQSVDVKIVGRDDTDPSASLKSIDELMCYEQGTSLVMDIASELISGVNLGNG